MIRLGCQMAEVVELGGIGRTLPDGHLHETRWSTADVDVSVDVFDTSCSAAGRRPELGALVQHVEITDDAEEAAHRYLHAASAVIPAEHLPSTGALLECPYVLIGTAAEIAGLLRRLRERWGFTRYTVRCVDPIVEIMAAM